MSEEEERHEQNSHGGMDISKWSFQYAEKEEYIYRFVFITYSTQNTENIACLFFLCMHSKLSCRHHSYTYYTHAYSLTPPPTHISSKAPTHTTSPHTHTHFCRVNSTGTTSVEHRALWCTLASQFYPLWGSHDSVQYWEPLGTEAPEWLDAEMTGALVLTRFRSCWALRVLCGTSGILYVPIAPSSSFS